MSLALLLFGRRASAESFCTLDHQFVRLRCTSLASHFSFVHSVLIVCNETKHIINYNIREVTFLEELGTIKNNLTVVALVTFGDLYEGFTP